MKTITLIISALLIILLSAGNIKAQPLTVNAGNDTTLCCSPACATLGGNPTASGGHPPYSYVWSPPSGLSSNTIANPLACVATTTTYTVTVWDSLFNSSSDAVTITIIPQPVVVSVSISAGANPVCDGTQVNFTAHPTNGCSPTYQWQVDFINVGTNDSTYTYIPADNDQVRCILTSNCPCATGNPATSNSIIMIVNPLVPVSVSVSANANNVCSGTAVTFTATPTNGCTPMYQWQVNGSNVGTSSTTFTYAPVNGDLVKCVMTSSCPCTSGSPATSNIFTMIVYNCTGNYGNPFDANNISIIYHPNSCTISIEFLRDILPGYELSIYNVQGQLLLRRSLYQEKTELDISGFPKGIYILKLSNPVNSLVKRFAKT